MVSDRADCCRTLGCPVESVGGKTDLSESTDPLKVSPTQYSERHRPNAAQVDRPEDCGGTFLRG